MKPNFIFLSGDIDAMRIENKDRRFFVADGAVQLDQLPPITAELRRVLAVAAAFPVLSARQAAAFCFLYRWLRVSMDCGQRTYGDFRIQRARTRYLHVATNRGNAS